MTANNSPSSIFFQNNLMHGYSKTHELKLITISLASPEKIKSWAEKVLPNGKIFGEITNANTLHYKTFKPQKGGLFCERIFGPLKDFECACGVKRRLSESERQQILKHKRVTHHFCPNCDVEYTWSVIRRYQLGYIRLNSPVCHLWYLKTNPSYLSILLDIRRRDLEAIVYCTQIPTIEYFWKTSKFYFMETSPNQIYSSWKNSFSLKLQNKVSLRTFEKKTRIEKENRQKYILESFTDWQKKIKSPINELFENDQAFDILKTKKDRQVEKNKKTLYLAHKMRKNFKDFKQKRILSLLVSELWKEFYKDLFSNARKKSSIILNKWFIKMDLLSKDKTELLQTKQKKPKIRVYGHGKKNPYIKNLSNLLDTSKIKLKAEIDHSLSLLTLCLEKNLPNNIEGKNSFNLDFNDSEMLFDLKVKKRTNDLFQNDYAFTKISVLLNDYYEIKLYDFLQQNKQTFFKEFFFFPLSTSMNDDFSDLLLKMKLSLNSLKPKDFFWKKDVFYPLFLECLTLSMVQQQFNSLIKKRQLAVFHSKSKETLFSKCLKHFTFVDQKRKNPLKNKVSNIKKKSFFFFNIMSGFENKEKWKKMIEKIKASKKKKNQSFLLEQKWISENQKSLDKLVSSKSYRSKEILKENSKSIYSKISVKRLNISLDVKTKKEKLVFTSRDRYKIANMPLMSTLSFLFDKKREKKEKRKKAQNGNTSLFQKWSSKYILTNNIYTVAYHYMWLLERDWKSFLHYNTAQVGFEDRKIAYYKNRIPYNIDFSRKPSVMGAGMLKKLLFEYEPRVLKEIAKQHQVLLLKLNNAVRSLRGNQNSKSNALQIQKFLQKRDHIIRRLKLIRILFRKNKNPNTMVLDILPVLPPDLRPILKLQGQIAASDLNRLYQRIIYRNDRVKKFLKDPATSQSFEMKYAQRLLQESVDNLIQNGKGNVKPETNSRGQPLKSLSEILKGKQGRFRQYLLGKRVDYSGRSVIVVCPLLKLYECGLPKEMALELFLPFLIKRILHYKLARTVIGAKMILKSNLSFTWNLLTEIMKNHPILLNRAPTLHRLGIQAFQPKLVEGRAILLHPLVCPAFNADFDGDQMAVHVPLTIEARTEAWKLMFSRNNLISPATGEPIVLPSQDMVLGCYYLTTEIPSKFLNSKAFVLQNFKLFRKFENNQILKRTFLKETQTFFSLYFTNLNEVMTAYQSNKITIQTPIWVKWQQPTEFGNDISQPLEIRISSYGYWEDVRFKYHSRFNKKGSILNQYIRTTAGRVLMNLMIQKILTN
uniref:DNA-directed RNA polymerase subunit beta' n=1 Tax=Rotundella rotunda TaxID=1357779 RepID=A0A140GII2_9CHLO|nr:beta subunit of RNA polymerase [Rotundella rotunda]